MSAFTEMGQMRLGEMPQQQMLPGQLSLWQLSPAKDDHKV